MYRVTLVVEYLGWVDLELPQSKSTNLGIGLPESPCMIVGHICHVCLISARASVNPVVRRSSKFLEVAKENTLNFLVPGRAATYR